ncbi:MAG: hypothetical protein NC313_04575 [Butyrivibrio sp.]|nr:hypothetical protein [Butyrivibrio sp.]
MNKYDERYDIRLAKPSEIKAIMQFINQHWKPGHIMATDEELFEYEFVEKDAVNMIIAWDKNTKTIEALSGFLPCSHTSDSAKLDVWGSFWKVNDSGRNMTFLGVELIRRLTELLHCRTHLGIGINPNTTLPIRKIAFQEKTAKMKHYYFLNPQIKNYRIAVIKRIKNSAMEDIISAGAKYTEFHSVDEIKRHFDIEKLNVIPYKDFWYINKRFFQHPYFSYIVYGLYNANNQVTALLIMREVEQFERKILRIVDYIGDQSLFAETNAMWLKLMQQNQYEYIDFYTFGFSEPSIFRAGFTLKDENDINIIPNYFEPFLQENVDIWVRYSIDGTLFCKADGDQDRPNQKHPLYH